MPIKRNDPAGAGTPKPGRENCLRGQLQNNKSAKSKQFRRINWPAINRAARTALPAILNRFAPGGVIHGDEWEGLNPRRTDRKPGSFKVNVRSGRWSDFATGDSGGDPVSLVAYLTGLPMGQAARQLAVMLGMAYD